MKLRKRVRSSFLRRWRSIELVPAWLKTGLSIFEQVKRLRSLFGMTQQQLAHRAETTQQAIAMLETEKVDPRLSSIQKVAEALECELLIQIIPKKEIETLLYEQAFKKAKLLVGLAAGSAALEKQLPGKQIVGQKIKEVAKRLMETKQKALWD